MTSSEDSSRCLDKPVYDENSPLLAEAGNINIDQKETSDDLQNEDFSFFQLHSRSKCTLILCCLSNLLVSCSFSILAPFFPKEAEKKGLSTTTTGFIFSVFELVIFVSSPIIGNFLTRIGTKFVFTTGICVGGCCSILFGLLDKCPPGVTFAAMCFACRCLEALAMSAFVTASFAILSNEFPKHVSTVVGISETFAGIGFMIGPALGGALYELNGYGLPFFVLGGLILFSGLVLAVYIPPPQGEESAKRKGSVLKLLSSPMVLMSMMSVFVCDLGISFLDPTLAKHLDHFNLSTLVIGLVFVITPFLYAIGSPVWGYLVDNKGFLGSLIVCGHLCHGIAMFCIGPCPWLVFLPFTLWLVIVGAVFMGMGVGLVVMPNIKCFVQGALDVGFEDNLDTYGLVFGLLNSVTSVGSFSGPLLGGVLVGRLGFDWSATIVGLTNFSLCAMSFMFFTRHYYLKKNSITTTTTKTFGTAQQSQIDKEHTDVTTATAVINGSFRQQDQGESDVLNIQGQGQCV